MSKENRVNGEPNGPDLTSRQRFWFTRAIRAGEELVEVLSLGESLVLVEGMSSVAKMVLAADLLKKDRELTEMGSRVETRRGRREGGLLWKWLKEYEEQNVAAARTVEKEIRGGVEQAERGILAGVSEEDGVIIAEQFKRIRGASHVITSAYCGRVRDSLGSSPKRADSGVIGGMKGAVRGYILSEIRWNNGK